MNTVLLISRCKGSRIDRRLAFVYAFLSLFPLLVGANDISSSKADSRILQNGNCSANEIDIYNDLRLCQSGDFHHCESWVTGTAELFAKDLSLPLVAAATAGSSIGGAGLGLAASRIPNSDFWRRALAKQALKDRAIRTWQKNVGESLERLHDLATSQPTAGDAHISQDEQMRKQLARTNELAAISRNLALSVTYEALPKVLTDKLAQYFGEKDLQDILNQPEQGEPTNRSHLENSDVLRARSAAELSRNTRQMLDALISDHLNNGKITVEESSRLKTVLDTRQALSDFRSWSHGPLNYGKRLIGEGASSSVDSDKVRLQAIQNMISEQIANYGHQEQRLLAGTGRPAYQKSQKYTIDDLTKNLELLPRTKLERVGKGLSHPRSAGIVGVIGAPLVLAGGRVMYSQTVNPSIPAKKCSKAELSGFSEGEREALHFGSSALNCNELVLPWVQVASHSRAACDIVRGQLKVAAEHIRNSLVRLAQFPSNLQCGKKSPKNEAPAARKDAALNATARLETVAKVQGRSLTMKYSEFSFELQKGLMLDARFSSIGAIEYATATVYDVNQVTGIRSLNEKQTAALRSGKVEPGGPDYARFRQSEGAEIMNIHALDKLLFDMACDPQGIDRNRLRRQLDEIKSPSPERKHESGEA